MKSKIASFEEWNQQAQSHSKMYGSVIVNECMRLSVAATDPNRGIQDILVFLGKTLGCDRAYVFEIVSPINFSNTYEWCKHGVVSQIETLKNEPMETVGWWWELFEDDQPVIIRNLEAIKEEKPQAYACFKPQDIQSLVAVTVSTNNKTIGFLGVDNPHYSQISVISPHMTIVGHFLSSLIERRNLVKDLEYTSYHDALTGALNRYAFTKMKNSFIAYHAVGLVYCDILGLKKINANFSHETGDRVIIHWYKLLNDFFDKNTIYRVGGDEFVIICLDYDKKVFEHKVLKLLALRNKETHYLFIGSVWQSFGQVNCEELLKMAEGKMYADKEQYYASKNLLSRKLHGCNFKQKDEQGDHSFNHFIRNNYFNEEVFFKSITASEASYYLCFGDLQTNVFYISDNMKETFGFKQNLIFDLIGRWEKQIFNEEDLIAYRRDIHVIMTQKKNIHDLRYRVKDKEDNEIWIRCYGLIEWNNDNTVPLFFSGCISRQEKEFLVDPITNYRKEHAAASKIAEIQQRQKTVTIIGFALNNFAEINELKGRYMANTLLQNITQTLERRFEGQLLFYRLDGLRFIAVLVPNCRISIDIIISEIRNIVDVTYQNNNIVVRTPCSAGVLIEHSGNVTPQDILVNMISLLSVAKRTPEQKYVIHSEKNILIQKEQAQMVMALIEDVLNGFENFRIVVQPTVSAINHLIISGESLLRWKFNGKDVSPLVFIPFLEKNRLIVPVGKWIFEQVVRTCKRIVAYMPTFKLAFNVSYHQVIDEAFIPYMKSILDKYHLEGKYLILELTETHFDDMPDKLRHFIVNCKKLGLEVALDDFGNGYSSLGMLLKYPASIVKLDRSLLSEMADSEDNTNFISTIVYACHKFGKKVCAEGVETASEVAIIEGTGCDMIQGYFFYSPMELRDFYSLLTEKQKNEGTLLY